MSEEESGLVMADMTKESEYKRLSGLLNKTLNERPLTEKEKVRQTLYFDIFKDFCLGLGVTELSYKYNLSRTTIYNAFEYAYAAEKVPDLEVHKLYAVSKLKNMISRLEKSLEEEKAKTVNQSTKYMGMLYGEIRKSQEQLNKILGVLSVKGEHEKDKGGNIIILNNIRTGGESDAAHRLERVQTVTESEEVPRLESEV